ncbi:RxLR effector protein [Phytophthora megakarya]|uniref:RxLR effector protein n=1 Tax=Phytophthora megakarya TaxID=4795 RepID=A0A225VMX6_9STRA|nr:RxLR effector protein [Phytophthora megakarya]
MKTTFNRTLRRSVFVVVTAVALVNATSVTRDASQLATNFQGFAHSAVQEEHYIASRRFLRIHKTEGGSTEERADLSKLLNGGGTVDDALQALLKNKQGVNNLITNKNLKTIIDYVKTFSQKTPGNGPGVVKSMTAVYGDDVVVNSLRLAMKDPEKEPMAKYLLGHVKTNWLTDKKSPDTVFKLLKLDDVATNPLSNPNLDLWTSYLRLYNHHNSVDYKDQTTLIKTFTAAYGEKNLAVLLNGARGDSELARTLQLQQFSRWMGSERPPKKLFSSVFKNDLQYNSIVEDYRAFYKLHRYQEKNIPEVILHSART